MNNKINWVSPITGDQLNFEICGIDDTWNQIGGIYMFCSLKNGNYVPLYIGQTENFANRLPNHERLNSAVKVGANYILAAIESNKRRRDRVEELLIKQFQPILNDQLK